MQVKFYVSWNFPKFSSIQFNSIFFLSLAQEKSHSECCIYSFKVLGLWSYAVYVFLPSLSGPSFISHRMHNTFPWFFKLASDGRNLRKVGFTQVEYYASWGVTVQYRKLQYIPSWELYLCVTYCPWLRGTGFIVHNFAQPLINDFADYKIPPIHETYENVLTVSYAMI